MQPIINIPISFLISLSILSGWFVSDFRINEAVEVAIISSMNSGVNLTRKLIEIPPTTTPNIDTNWFSSSSGMTYQLPSAQTRKSDDDERIAVGGAMGESFSNNDDL